MLGSCSETLFRVLITLLVTHLLSPLGLQVGPKGTGLQHGGSTLTGQSPAKTTKARTFDRADAFDRLLYKATVAMGRYVFLDSWRLPALIASRPLRQA